MGTVSPELPTGQSETIGDDVAGMFSFYIDPEGAAKRVHHKWFWVGPLILVSIVAIVTGLLRMPVVERAMESLQMPGNATPEQLATILKWQRLAVWAAPVGTVLVYAFNALILFASGSVLSVKGSFRSYFNLVAGCSLIQMLALIAGTIVLRTKQDISSMAELQPALGLDIFVPEGTSKFLTAFLGFFSIFEIWWLVMAVLVVSYAFRVTKGKALTVVLPLTLLGLVFRVLMAGLQRT